MNKGKIGLITISLLMLTACGAEVNELFDAGQFESAEFLDNYYEVFPSPLLETPVTKQFIVDESNSDYGTLFDTNIATAPIKYILDTDYALGFEEEMYDLYNAESETPLNVLEVSNQYFYKNRLMNLDRSFKYGYFSKLTDGLVHCDGSGAHVRIQLKEQGMGQIFSKELIDYSTMMLVFRGGTNIPWGTEGYPHLDAEERTSQLAINVALYVANNDDDSYHQYLFTTTKDVKTDDNGMNTNILYINLAEVLGNDVQLIKRATAFSINYKLLDHPKLKPIGGSPLPGYEDKEFALMFYELMFPHSSWN